jgi:methyl acetate hydrolase
MRSRLAKIHARLPDGSLAPIPLEIPQPPALELGGAGLYGTAGDYLKFLRMVLNGGDSPGGRILKSETLEEMKRNQIGSLDVPSLTSCDKTLCNDMPLPPEIPHKWGLAWLINTKPLPTGRPAGSLMWAGLTNCYYWIDPSSGVAGVMLSQVLPFADVKALPLFFGLEATVYANR